jgi:tRNA(Ile2) C34 agmatinyltransferase TiaS
LSCAFCHFEHRDIKACDDCHGRPHSKGTHNMFKCNVCHGMAHDLNKSPET